MEKDFDYYQELFRKAMAIGKVQAYNEALIYSDQIIERYSKGQLEKNPAIANLLSDYVNCKIKKRDFISQLIIELGEKAKRNRIFIKLIQKIKEEDLEKYIVIKEVANAFASSQLREYKLYHVIIFSSIDPNNKGIHKFDIEDSPTIGEFIEELANKYF